MKTYTTDEIKLGQARVHMVCDGGNADFTNRLLPPHLESMAEMRENGTIDGVPVSIYYMLDADDCVLEDLGNIRWQDKVDRIEIDLCECDCKDITDNQIDALLARLH